MTFSAEGLDWGLSAAAPQPAGTQLCIVVKNIKATVKNSVAGCANHTGSLLSPFLSLQFASLANCSGSLKILIFNC